jgi:UDP-glucuronate 4-epimerase
MKITGLRFFTVYGPWGRPDQSLFLFVNSILNDKEIKIFNNGEMKRDFTYIDDIIEAIYLLDSAAENESIINRNECLNNHEIYNIGNNNPVKLMDFIGEIEHSLGASARKLFLPMQDGDVVDTHSDTTLLYKKTNFIPKTSVHSGIKNFIDWYLKYYKVPNS